MQTALTGVHVKLCTVIFIWLNFSPQPDLMDVSVDNQNGLMQLQIFTLDPFNEQVILDLLGILPVQWLLGQLEPLITDVSPTLQCISQRGGGVGAVANPPAGVYFPIQTPIFVATTMLIHVCTHK